MDFMSKFGRRVFLFCLLIAFFCGTVHSTDYNFTKSDSVTFPATGDLQAYAIYDVNGDGFDELIALFVSSYYVYSFQLGQIIYSDSAAFNACAIGDIDGDGENELALLHKSSYYSQLFRQELSFDSDPQLISEYQGHSAYLPGDPYSSVTLQVGDFDNNGTNEVFEGLAGEYFMYYYPVHGQLLDYYAGEAIFIDPLTGDVTRDIHGEYTHSMGSSVVVDLGGNGYDQLIAWGQYYYYEIRYVELWPEYWGLETLQEIRYDINFVDESGYRVLSPSTIKPISVVGGDLSVADPGDEAVFFKFDNGDGLYKLQLLNRENQTDVIKWSKEVTSAQYCLIALSSLPGTFCASDGSGQFTLYNGSDGSVIGTVNGLLKTSNTSAGHFADFPDDPIQVVQFSSNKAYLYALESITGVEEVGPGNLPNDFILSQNYPNPFNPSTTIRFSVSSRAAVTLSVYNLLGQKVIDLVDEEMPVGNYQVDWNGTDDAGRPVSSGVYLYRLKYNGRSQTKKMILMK